MTAASSLLLHATAQRGHYKGDITKGTEQRAQRGQSKGHKGDITKGTEQRALRDKGHKGDSTKGTVGTAQRGLHLSLSCC